jgi:hypothetical protein
MGFGVKDLVDSVPQWEKIIQFQYGLRLSPAKETQWEAKYKPVITFRYAFLSCFDIILNSSISSKYYPYDALRPHFGAGI